MGPSAEAKVAPSLLLRGLRPLGRQQRTLPCHPYYVREVPSLTLPSPWGFNASRHQEKSRRDHSTVPTQFFLERKEGFEPPRGCPHRLLRPARLPVPPLPHWYLPTILIGHWGCQG